MGEQSLSHHRRRSKAVLRGGDRFGSFHAAMAGPAICPGGQCGTRDKCQAQYMGDTRSSSTDMEADVNAAVLCQPCGVTAVFQGDGPVADGKRITKVRLRRLERERMKTIFDHELFLKRCEIDKGVRAVKYTSFHASREAGRRYARRVDSMVLGRLRRRRERNQHKLDILQRNQMFQARGKRNKRKRGEEERQNPLDLLPCVVAQRCGECITCALTQVTACTSCAIEGFRPVPSEHVCECPTCCVRRLRSNPPRDALDLIIKRIQREVLRSTRKHDARRRACITCAIQRRERAGLSKAWRDAAERIEETHSQASISWYCSNSGQRIGISSVGEAAEGCQRQVRASWAPSAQTADCGWDDNGDCNTNDQSADTVQCSGECNTTSSAVQVGVQYDGDCQSADIQCNAAGGGQYNQ